MKNLKRRCWKIAYRKTAEENKMPVPQGQFKTVKNPWWGWVADPFLFDHGGKLYLFAEIYSYMKQKGMLGYCVFENGEFGEWTIAIEEPFHLSYPNIVEADGEIYICPESFMAQKISIYRAVEFPTKWQRVADVSSGLPLSDTTFYKKGKQVYGFTFNHIANPPELLLFKLVNGAAEFADKPISTDNSLARPGGNIFSTDDGEIRVGQNGVGAYGSGLAFLKMNFDFENYTESLISRWGAEDIELDNPPKNLRGIHTFNRACGYDIVDIMFLTANPLDVIGRVVNGVKRRLKK